MSSETPYTPRHYQPGLADPPGARGPPGLPGLLLRRRAPRRLGARALNELRDVVLQRFVRRGPDVNHVPGLVVAVRDAIGNLLLVREVREVELRTAHDRGHVEVPDRDEHLQEWIVRHGGAERLGHVHVAVLIVGPGPHVAGRRVVE